MATFELSEAEREVWRCVRKNAAYGTSMQLDATHLRLLLASADRAVTMLHEQHECKGEYKRCDSVDDFVDMLNDGWRCIRTLSDDVYNFVSIMYKGK